MGLVGLSNVVAVEGAKYNIKSNVIAPIARTRLTENLLGPLAEALAPECVTPLVVYLSSRENENTHEIYSVGGGRFARVFVGLCQGWTAGDVAGQVASAEEIQANIGAIRETEGYIIPDSIADEMSLVAKSFKGD